MYLNWILDVNLAYPKNGFTNDDMGDSRRSWINNSNYSPALPQGMPVFLMLMGLR
jgi:hypothetical protein